MTTNDDWKIVARRKLAMLQNQHAAYFSAHNAVVETRRDLRMEVLTAADYVAELLRHGGADAAYIARAQRAHERAIENLANFEETLPSAMPRFDARRSGQASEIGNLLDLWS